MNKKDLRLLIRSFDEDLPPNDSARLEEVLRGSSRLREERDRLAALRGMMAAGRNVAFKPFFAGRVLSRLAPQAVRTRAEDFAINLTLAFRRVALAGSLVVLGLTAYNVLAGPSPADASVFETLLGLTPDTIDSALALELP